MKQYYDNIMQKEPHERRRHAIQLSAGITAAVFVVWITTLGLRLNSNNDQIAQQDNADNQTSLSASVAQGTYNGPNTLYVASTTGF